MSTGATDRLMAAARERKLLPFIGAGFSKNIDRSMPSWDELIDIAAKLLNFHPAVLRAQGDSYQIAEFLETQGKLRKFYEVVNDKLNSPAFDVLGSEPHTLLPYVDAESVYTTNWDGWIEAGYLAQGVPHRLVRTPGDLSGAPVTPTVRPASARFDDAKLASLRVNQRTDLYKFHGDLGIPDSLVFKESDYFDRMRFEDPLDIRLRADILDKSVLFIGYSYRDMDVRLIWHRLHRALEAVPRPNRLSSFFVTYGDFPLQRELFDKHKIEVVAIDPLDKRSSLTKLLEQIINAQS